MHISLPLAQCHPTEAISLHTPLRAFLERYEAKTRHHVFSGPRYRMNYSVLGDGPTLFIVPGICSTRILFAALAVELSAWFRVVVYDLPGIASGDGANLHRYQLEDYPTDLFALADHLHDRTFDAMGLSFGSTILLKAMHREPARVTRAMLCGGFAHRPMTQFERQMLRVLRHWPGRMGQVLFMNQITRYNHGRELEYREPGLCKFLEQENGRTPVRTAAAQVLAVDQTDLRDILSDIENPTLIVHGNEDRMVSVDHAAELSNRLSNVRIMLVPRCGHMPHLSHPELLARAAHRFFFESACHGPSHAGCAPVNC